MSTNMLNAAVKSLNERGDWRHALKLLHQIVVNYPDSEEARKAQVMIDKLADEGKELSPAQENAISCAR